MSSGGHLRSRRDTSGHATKTVRDREAPGSNPGPPDHFLIRNRRFPMWFGVSCTPPYHKLQPVYIEEVIPVSPAFYGPRKPMVP